MNDKQLFSAINQQHYRSCDTILTTCVCAFSFMVWLYMLLVKVSFFVISPLYLLDYYTLVYIIHLVSKSCADMHQFIDCDSLLPVFSWLGVIKLNLIHLYFYAQLHILLQNGGFFGCLHDIKSFIEVLCILFVSNKIVRLVDLVCMAQSNVTLHLCNMHTDNFVRAWTLLVGSVKSCTSNPSWETFRGPNLTWNDGNIGWLNKTEHPNSSVHVHGGGGPATFADPLLHIL